MSHARRLGLSGYGLFVHFALSANSFMGRIYAVKM